MRIQTMNATWRTPFKLKRWRPAPPLTAANHIIICNLSLSNPLTTLRLSPGSWTVDRATSAPIIGRLDHRHLASKREKES